MMTEQQPNAATHLQTYPRVVVAGTAGDAGKSIVSIGLLALWNRQKLKTAAFKKGPDFIDAAWLGLAANTVGRNLDTYLLGFDGVRRSFLQYANRADISLIEGNRGLYDGVDDEGTHSTAALAACLQTPVILVLNVPKMTRTAAAIVHGCITFDPDVHIAGIILNRVANARHEAVIRRTIEENCQVPVLGAIPNISSESVIPMRHLGLITPAEEQKRMQIAQTLADCVEKNLDCSRILEIAQSASPWNSDEYLEDEKSLLGADIRIGYFYDEAFSFYYPENLESLKNAGVQLIPVSPLHDTILPDIDALYIGGGFPEVYADQLVRNRRLQQEVAAAAVRGLPIYAECGGLIYLADAIRISGKEYTMSGVFPIHLTLHERPQGHGYCNIQVDQPNPFYDVGTVLKGHEFHYTSIDAGAEKVSSVFGVTRGTGCFKQRDGLIFKNTLASYTHIHALGTTQWATGLIAKARMYRETGGRCLNN